MIWFIGFTVHSDSMQESEKQDEITQVSKDAVLKADNKRGQIQILFNDFGITKVNFTTKHLNDIA